ncbi:uncharacterized protein LOC142463607 [Ascaphus truei]|uniref:uncharacterized protein LOC142463607 n=1 Tax=Ascaphus truei TaxID=8439 RepID=UPI003F5921B4
MENVEEKSTVENMEEKSPVENMEEKSTVENMEEKSTVENMEEKLSIEEKSPMENVEEKSPMKEKPSMENVEEKSSAKETKRLREEIRRFSFDNCALGNQGYNRVLLQLFGCTGHGKSSFINSCKYVLEDREYVMHAEANAGHSSVTMERRAYPLTDTITIVDNRPCTMDNAKMGEVYAQLGNFVPLNENVRRQSTSVEMVRRLENAEPNYTDFIVPVYVQSVRECVRIAEWEQAEFKTIFKNCRDLTGVFPIIVLTNKTSGNYFKIEEKFRCLGAEVVFALENYTQEDQMKTRKRHTGILQFLQHVLEDVSFWMEQERNPEKERADRKMFLLKFIRDRERAGKKDEMEKLQKEKARRNN